MIGMPSAKRYTKASQEKIGDKELSRAVEVKKPQEAQKAKALWKMNAAKDAGRRMLRSNA